MKPKEMHVFVRNTLEAIRTEYAANARSDSGEAPNAEDNQLSLGPTDK